MYWDMILSVSYITRHLTYDDDSIINTIFFLIRDDKLAAIQGDSRGNMNVLGDDIISQFHKAISNLR